MRWGKRDFDYWCMRGCKKVRDDVQLDLYDCKISHIPDGISNLTYLSELDLSDNTISAIPDSILGLEFLIKVNMLSNNISTIPESLCKLPNLEYLLLGHNIIHEIPQSIVNVITLRTLDLSCNRIDVIPDYLFSLCNLETLILRGNRIIIIPDSIVNLCHLQILNLSHNCIDSIPTNLTLLPELDVVHLDNNRISVIPDFISSPKYFRYLILNNNTIKTIPASIITLMNLKVFNYNDNPIDYIPPNVKHMISRMKNVTSVYSDSQLVHNSSIQESVRKSIENILSVPHDLEEDILQIIKADRDLDDVVKGYLVSYSEDMSVHSQLYVNFENVLRGVWNRIRVNPHSKEVKIRLMEEMRDSHDKCFTGRISRLVNCLSGFDELVSIQLSDSDRIGTIIFTIKNSLNPYDRERHIFEARLRLRESGYDDETTEEWVYHI